jgi:hypothetical protein
MFTTQFIPGANKEQADWFNDLQRVSCLPEDAARNFLANGEVDIGALLPQVKVPTLVMHCRNDARVPFEAGRRRRDSGGPLRSARGPQSHHVGGRAGVGAFSRGVEIISCLRYKTLNTKYILELGTQTGLPPNMRRGCLMSVLALSDAPHRAATSVDRCKADLEPDS